LKNGNSIKYVNGIDISAKNYLRDGEDSYLEFEENVDWNLINWNTLAENNVKFVILRATETSTGIIDKAFEHSYEEAKRVGISVGAYYVSYATTQKEAEIEAERFNNILKNK
jgi:GH25 family lysozyme M1 (1,4-beta-N-acetylmuramidase)